MCICLVSFSSSEGRGGCGQPSKIHYLFDHTLGELSKNSGKAKWNNQLQTYETCDAVETVGKPCLRVNGVGSISGRGYTEPCPDRKRKWNPTKKKKDEPPEFGV